MYKYHSENLCAPIDALHLRCCTQIPVCSLHVSGHSNHPMQSLPVLHSYSSQRCKTGRSNGSKDRERPNLRYLDHSCCLMWVKRLVLAVQLNKQLYVVIWQALKGSRFARSVGFIQLKATLKSECEVTRSPKMAHSFIPFTSMCNICTYKCAVII